MSITFFDEGKSQPVSLLRVRCIALIKLIEYMLSRLF